ncbi:MAG: M67 family metallopeptidase, partial [Anaerolineae bacterium]
EMVAHAREEAPLEACGILAGRDGAAVRLYRARNADESASTYRMDPQEQFEIFRDLEDRGLEIWGIYHSHPRTAAYPSATDVRLAYYPDAYHFIVSLAGPEPIIRSFRIGPDGSSEVIETPLTLS